MKNSVAYQWAGLLGWSTFTVLGFPAFIIGIKYQHWPLVWFGIGLFFIAIVLIIAMFISIGIGLHNEHKENMKEMYDLPI